MYYTNEYTVLVSPNGEDITLKPGQQNAFQSIPSGYRPTSSAYVRDLQSNDIVATLDVSLVFDGIGNAPVKKAPTKPKQEPKQESLIESEDG